ncbi:EAL domain-containing protein [Nautilia sp.]
MALALLMAVKDKTLKTIIKISLPFTLLNIDTLLIYAVIVFNRFFLIPFIFLPVINLFIAYFFLHFIPVTFTDYYLVWTTPPVLDAYLKTGGNIYVVMLQIFIIIFDTAVYFYFAKKFSSSNSLISEKEILEKNLDIHGEIKSKETILAFKAQKELIAAQAQLNSVIKSLNKDNMKIYYQPKVDIKNRKYNKYEALIRYNDNGKITGPTFLSIIEEAGLAPVIDIWVCKEVKKHIREWKKKHFYPEISVNLHPDTLNSKDAVKKIVSILKHERIKFEIIERSLLNREKEEKNINFLKENGFNLAIDDFGVGYSSLKIITRLNIDELKIDKSLIDIIHTRKGFAVCKHTVGICHEIGCKVVAEGVETKLQLEYVEKINTNLVQGYYFAPALPFERIISYKPVFS